MEYFHNYNVHIFVGEMWSQWKNIMIVKKDEFQNIY